MGDASGRLGDTFSPQTEDLGTCLVEGSLPFSEQASHNRAGFILGVCKAGFSIQKPITITHQSTG